MNPTQCKMARAALGWGVRELAAEAQVGKGTVSRFESGGDAFTSTATKLKTALESTGKVRFEGECCVCLVPAEKTE